MQSLYFPFVVITNKLLNKQLSVICDTLALLWRPCNDWVTRCGNYPTGSPFTNAYRLRSQHGKVITSIIKYGMKLLTHSQTSTVQPLKFGNGEVFLSHTLPCMWWLIHVGIKVKPYYQKGPLGYRVLNRMPRHFTKNSHNVRIWKGYQFSHKLNQITFSYDIPCSPFTHLTLYTS